MSVQDAFAGWMLDERGWSKETRRTRTSTVEAARRFLADTGRLSLLRARPEDIVAFLARARHPRTRNRELADLKAFYRFLRERGLRSVDPTSGITRIREPRNLPRPLPHRHAVLLLAAAPSVSRRAHVVVATLLYAGLRRAEACGLMVADVDLDSRELRVMGKGSKERVVPMAGKLAVVLSAWRARPDADAGYLFPGQRDGQSISPVTLWRDVSLSAQLAGVGRVSPHRLRHTAATELLDRGADISYVQAFLGHESLASTQVYTKVRMRRVAKWVRQLDFDR